MNIEPIKDVECPALPPCEVAAAICRRAGLLLGRELTEPEQKTLLLELRRTPCADRELALAISRVCGGEVTPYVKAIPHRLVGSDARLRWVCGRLRLRGFRQPEDYITRDAGDGHWLICWRVTSKNLSRIARYDRDIRPTLSGALASRISHLEGMEALAIYEMLRDVVADTTPLVSGLRILSRAWGRSAPDLVRYVINLHLMGALLGKDAGDPLYRQSWGSEVALNRVNPDIATQYMAYTGLSAFYPTSDIEQPTDNIRQEQEDLKDMDNARKPKKLRRRLGR